MIFKLEESLPATLERIEGSNSVGTGMIKPGPEVIKVIKVAEVRSLTDNLYPTSDSAGQVITHFPHAWLSLVQRYHLRSKTQRAYSRR